MSLAETVALTLALVGLGCSERAPRQPDLEQERGLTTAPFSSLPPLHQTWRPSGVQLPPGPPEPHSVALQLRPLKDTAQPRRPPPHRQVNVTAHPPLAGNPRGAVAFVFDLPMVDASSPPIPPPEILIANPPAPGTLRWLGDRTLVFLPRARLRYATRYTFRLGKRLGPGTWGDAAQDVLTGFVTQAPRLHSSSPDDGTRGVSLEPLLHLRFNQPMDSNGVLSTLRLSGPGAPALKLARPPRPPAPEDVWLKPTGPLRPSTDYQLILPAGLRGAEGTMGSLATRRIHFTTAGPLRLRSVRCQHLPCQPGDALLLDTIGSPGPLCTLLRVDPPVEELRCTRRPGGAVLSGSFAAGATYQVGLRSSPSRDPATGRAVAVTFAPPQPLLSLFPNRPLLTVGLRDPLLPASGSDAGRLKVAPVAPGVVSSLLGAIADPGALPPFQLTQGPRRDLPLHPSGRGFDLGSLGGRPTLLLAALRPANPLATGTRVLRRAALVQITGLALVARYGWSAGAALVTSRETGRPVAGALIHLQGADGQILWRGRADARGLVQLPGRRRLSGRGPFTLWAMHRGDRCFVVLDGGGEDQVRAGGYQPGGPPPTVERIIGGVFPDQASYGPGDLVRLFGVLRGQTRLPRGTVGPISSDHSRLAYRVVSEREEEIASGETTLGPAGLFRIDLKLDRNVRPGLYTAWLRLPGTRPETADWVLGTFRVVARQRGLSLQLDPPATPALDKRAEIRISIREPGDEPASGATVRWRVYRRGEAPPPSGNPDFQFGRALRPDGSLKGTSLPIVPPAPGDAMWVDGGEVSSDARGRALLTPRLTAPRTMDSASFDLVVEATTLDGRTIRRVHSLIARRHPLQLGILPAGRLVRVGEPLALWLMSVDGQGYPRPMDGYVVTAHSLDARLPRTRAVARCRGDLSLATGRCSLTLQRPGRYLLRASPAGASTKGTMSAAPAEVVVHAYGASGAKSGSHRSGSQGPSRPPPAVELIPDHLSYPEGGRARILLRSPVTEGTALLTLERDGVAMARVVSIRGPETLLSLNLGRGLAPNVWVGVTVLGPASGPPLPPSALSERIRLDVRPAEGYLRVELATPVSKLLPGAEMEASLRVTDRDGRPVPAAVMLLLQPESDTPPPDLAASVLRDRGPGVALRLTAAHRATARPRWVPRSGWPPPADVRPAESQPGGQGRGERQPEPSRGHKPDRLDRAERTDAPESQQPVAAGETSPSSTRPVGGLFFRGPLLTDSLGRLAVTVPLPSRRGRYRLVALVADRLRLARLGRKVLQLTVEPAISLDLAHPEMLRIGDRTQVIARVRNHTDHPLRVTVMARSDQLPITSRVRRLHLASGGEGRVVFTARATRVGLARIQVAATAGRLQAALERRVLVQPSATRLTLRRLGVVRTTAAMRLRSGQRSSTPSSHTLLLSTSPLGAALPALRWLMLREPLTLEAAAIRLLALVTARRHRHSPLGALLPDAQARRTLCRRAISLISDLELPRGRLRRYRGGPPAGPLELAFAMLAFRTGRSPECLVDRSLLYSLGEHLRRLATNPAASPLERVTAFAALYRSRATAPRRLLAELTRLLPRLSLVGRGRLLPLLSPTAREGVGSDLDRAMISRPRSLRPDLQVELLSRRILAIAERGTRKGDLERWVRRLMALGRSGRWGSARATAWALLALSRADGPLALTRGPVEARAWLDGRHWGGGLLQPRTSDIISLTAPPKETWDPARLVLRSRGDHPLYFLLTRVVKRPPALPAAGATSLAMELAPARGAGRKMPPQTPGTPLQATGPGPGLAGAGPLTLAPGQSAVGRITLVTTRSQGASVLEVTIPAGCEVVDPGYPMGGGSDRNRFPPLPILDAIVQKGVLRLHLPDLPPGIHEHRLVIQARFPGRFGCAPATLRRAQDERLLARAARCRPVKILSPPRPIRERRSPGPGSPWASVPSL